MSRRVLLTGFAPFDGQLQNPSWLAVQQAAQEWTGPGALATALLPVSFAGVGPALDRAIAAHRPDVVVCAGLAEGRDRVGLERTAVNVIDARIPDEDGRAPVDEPVVPGGPVAYLSSLPIKACVAELTALDLPGEVSNTAGTYVCNAAFYHLQHALRGWPWARGGFVHLPQASETARSDGPALPLDVLAQALVVIARTSLTVEADLPVSGGREH